jgi:CRISPR-associated protein Csm3
MKNFILKGIVSIKFKLRLKTGMHIGGAKETFEIGGVDNPVIKLPMDLNLGKDENGEDWIVPKDAPYIPGSSLKGKIRTLLEWFLSEPKGIEGEEKTSVEYMVEKFKDNEKKIGAPCECGTCSICKLFGVGNSKVVEDLLKKLEKLPGPPRAEFSDAYPTPESLKKLEESLGEGLYTEIKYENRINRLSGTVEKGGLRNLERVPAGTEFKGEITVDIYSEEDMELVGKLITGLKLLENSYLGGSGSRGYGKVEFTEIKITFKDRNYFEKGTPEKEIETAPLVKITSEEIVKKLKATMK